MKNIKKLLSLTGVCLLLVVISLPCRSFNVKADDIEPDSYLSETYQDVVDINYLNIYSSGGGILSGSALYGFNGFVYARNNQLAINTMSYAYLGQNNSLNSYLNVYQNFRFDTGSLFNDGRYNYYPYETVYNLSPSSSGIVELTYYSNDFVIPALSVPSEFNLNIFRNLFAFDQGIYNSQNNTFTHKGLNLINYEISCNIVYYTQYDPNLKTIEFYSSDPLTYYDNELGLIFSLGPLYETIIAADAYINDCVLISNFKLSLTFGNVPDSSYIRLRSLLIDTMTVPTYNEVLGNLFFNIPEDDATGLFTWFIPAISSFLNTQFIPGITFASLLAVIIAIPLVSAFLKMLSR